MYLARCVASYRPCTPRITPLVPALPPRRQRLSFHPWLSIALPRRHGACTFVTTDAIPDSGAVTPEQNRWEPRLAAPMAAWWVRLATARLAGITPRHSTMILRSVVCHACSLPRCYDVTTLSAILALSRSPCLDCHVVRLLSATMFFTAPFALPRFHDSTM